MKIGKNGGGSLKEIVSCLALDMLSLRSLWAPRLECSTENWKIGLELWRFGTEDRNLRIISIQVITATEIVENSQAVGMQTAKDEILENGNSKKQ